MLLRLLPLATPSNPSPLTILFTLPLPTHPYTSKSLPLPPALLSHRSLCLQEDIECPNVLLGERSSWISGIIDDVTFSLPLSTIAVNLIDGTSITMPITPACVAQLHRVVEEVHLSFAASSPSPKPVSSNASSSSSSSTVAPSTPPAKRTPSSLLLTLLSPLLSTNNVPVPDPRPSLAAAPCAPARIHRRQARSLLVDTYRRHVMPILKDKLPSAFLPWAIQSETARQTEEFSKLKIQMNELLANAGLNKTEVERSMVPLTRCRSHSTSTASSLSEDESDSESSPSPVTPATSTFSRSACPTPPRQRPTVSPQAYLMTVPPAHLVPAQQRATYSSQLARLTQIASRVSQIKKLGVRYEREEGKRKWLEGLERGRAVDKALRIAFSNGCSPKTSTVPVTAEPTKASRLWRSWTADDEELADLAVKDAAAVHPAMMDCSSDEEDELPVTPQKSRTSTVERPLLPSLVIEVPASVEMPEDLKSIIQVRRPSLEHGQALLPRISEDTPGLVSSQSTESLVENYEWDRDGDIESARLMSPPVIGRHWQAVATVTATPGKNVKSTPLVVERSEDDEASYYGQCAIYA